MLIKIDRDSRTPLYRQIIDKVRRLIDQGTLGTGTPMPASRSLAATLGVDRSTVYLAYAELQALGYLDSRPGSYNIVQKRQREAVYEPDRPGLIDWAKQIGPIGEDLYATLRHYTLMNLTRGKPGRKLIDFASLTPDPRLYPLVDFRRCVRDAILSAGSEALLYGNFKGYAPLNGYVAQHLRLHGIAVSEEEILITNGAQQGFDLICRLFGKAKPAVALELPSYALVFPVLQFEGWKIHGIPMKEDGLDLAVLERVLKKEKVSFVYTMPNFHNPTGITTSYAHREELLHLCERHRVPLVEDGFEEEMKYCGKVALPIKSIDEKNIVIYLGTFSKSLFPGLRLGWITADKELIARLAALKRFTDLSTSSFNQIIMHRFCTGGYYEKHLKRMHQVFRRRMQLTLKLLKEKLPAWVSWTKPTGGYTLWVKLPRLFPAVQLLAFFSSYGIAVSPGELFFPSRRESEYFRLSISCLDEDEITTGIERLGQALRRIKT